MPKTMVTQTSRKKYLIDYYVPNKKEVNNEDEKSVHEDFDFTYLERGSQPTHELDPEDGVFASTTSESKYMTLKVVKKLDIMIL